MKTYIAKLDTGWRAVTATNEARAKEILEAQQAELKELRSDIAKLVGIPDKEGDHTDALVKWLVTPGNPYEKPISN